MPKWHRGIQPTHESGWTKILFFHGLFETYSSAKSYITALTGLLSVTSKTDIRTIISDGDQAAIFFDSETVDSTS